MNTDWVARLNSWLRTSGWSVAEYARRVNADGGNAPSESLIRKYLEGKVAQPRGNIMSRLAAPFGKTALQLQLGIENLSPAGAKIPLLDANELGTFDPALNINAWEGRSVSVFSSDVGPNWFGVEVPDDACSPKIPKGSIVYCNPDADVHPGDYVIAKVPGEATGVVRRYRKTDGLDSFRFELMPENSDYPKFISSQDVQIEVWKVAYILLRP